jgi:hypothetical protein
MNRVKFLWLDHREGLVLKVLLVSLSSAFLIAAFELLLMLCFILFLLLCLLCKSFTLAALEGIQVVGVNETMRVIFLT